MSSHLERFDEMPDGWRVDTSWGSPEHGWIPICNGRSILNGGRKGLLRLSSSPVVPELKPVPAAQPLAPQTPPKAEPTRAEKQTQSRAVNRLAREKFKLKVMQELAFDLTVCRLEGWDFTQYVSDLKQIIDEVHRKVTLPARRQKRTPDPKQVQIGLWDQGGLWEEVQDA